MDQTKLKQAVRLSGELEMIEADLAQAKNDGYVIVVAEKSDGGIDGRQPATGGRVRTFHNSGIVQTAVISALNNLRTQILAAIEAL
jgi:hypothetical protein